MGRIPVAIVILLFLMAGTVTAHRPLFLDSEQVQKPYVMPDPEVSRAVYRELAPEQADYYQFTVPEGGLDFFAQLLVPYQRRFSDFHPTLVLMGPGLPQSGSALPIDVPPDFGVVIKAWENKEVFFEPFTQTRYYMAREMRRSLPSGTYQLAVYHPQGRGGKYTLTVGEEEKWTWKDLFAFWGMWLRTRWWYSPGQTVAMILAGLAGVGILVGLAVRFLAKRV